jgi:glycosyl transferase family 25
MAEQLGRLALAYDFVDAVRGSDAIADRKLYDRDGALLAEGRELRPGEVGCALSHGRAYAEIIRRGLPWALVLEDDAVLHEDLPAVLGRLESGLLEQGDLVFLERCDYVRPGSGRRLVGRYRIASPILVRAGSTAQAAGYVITNGAAQAIAGINEPVRFPADSWGHYEGFVRYRGVQPTLTLIKQSAMFESTTLGTGSRPEFKKYHYLSLVAHDFLFYTGFGRILQAPLRVLLKKTR